MLNNPALTSSLPTLEGIQYAAKRGCLNPAECDFSLSSDLLVAFNQGTIFTEDVFFYPPYVVNPTPFVKADLSMPARTALLQGLTPLLSWGDPWTVPDYQTGTRITSWMVAIYTADGQLYRWQGPNSPVNGGQFHPGVNPVGLDTVNIAFKALVPR